jgi:hypothetical protein
MKKLSLPLATVTLVLLSGAPLFAQMTGTSHPEELDDTKTAPPAETSHYVPPSHAASVTAATHTPAQTAPVLYQRNPSVAAAPVQTAAANSADPTYVVTNDVNSGVVVDVPPAGPNALPIGATLKATLQQPISTETTAAGTRFTAALSTDVTRNGMVLLPAGSLVYGRITHIHGGLRIGGSSAIRLHPDSVSLPDGTTYALHADVTDLDHAASHVNSEGTIVGNTHPKETAAAVGLTTTSAVVAGAMIGGGVGAVVGLGVGAGAATVWWLRRDREQELPTGTEIVFTLNTPLQLNPATH